MKRDRSIPTLTGRSLSILLHPTLIPFYAVALLLLSDTLLSFADSSTKLFFAGSVAVNTIAIPAFCILLLRIFGILKGFTLETPRERMLPLAVTVLCYAASAWMLRDMPTVFLVRKFFTAATACTLLCLVLTPFWKISLHMTAQGGMVALLLLLNIMGTEMLLLPFCCTILFAGLLGSARLWLGAHTPAQIFAGFAAGFVLTTLIVLFV